MSAEPSSSGGVPTALNWTEPNCVARSAPIRGELQAARSHVAFHDVLQAGFVDGNAAIFQQFDLRQVQIEAKDVVAYVRKASACH
jgi:hypothetical protein